MVNRVMSSKASVSSELHYTGWTASFCHLLAVALAVECCVATGCSRSGVPQERLVPIREATALEQVRSYLGGYVMGLPVGSERELFSKMAEDVGKADPNVAVLVGRGLNEIEARPAQAARLAEKLLAQLGAASPP